MTILPLIPQRCTPNSTGRATGEETKKKRGVEMKRLFFAHFATRLAWSNGPDRKSIGKNFKIRRGKTKRLKPNEYIGFPGQRRDEANPVGRSRRFSYCGTKLFSPRIPLSLYSHSSFRFRSRYSRPFLFHHFKPIKRCSLLPILRPAALPTSQRESWFL